jgi:predicted outer membrane protein
MRSGVLGMAILAGAVLVAATSARAAREERTSPLAEVLSELRLVHERAIELGEWAQREGLDRRVRAYGERLARDHARLDRLLLQVARNHRLRLEPARAETAARKEWAEEYREMLHVLADARGPGFDRAFLGMMIVFQQRALQVLEEGRLRIQDRDVWAVFDKVNAIFQQHLTLAREIRSRLEGKEE